VTDDIRADPGLPVDLLVIGGLTIDVLEGREVAGGAARYATEAAVAAGLRVALHTVAGPEQVAQSELSRLAAQAVVIVHPAPTSIVFEHHGRHDDRRLRLRSGTEPMRIPDPGRLPPARAVLFAPVAGEVGVDAIRAITAPLRAAGLQGWLRQTDTGGWVSRVPLSTLDETLATSLRSLDLLMASVDELRGDDGLAAVGRLRAWAGAGPELVVTAGAAGAWADDGGGSPRHVAAEVVANRHTIGAGDAFAAVLAAERGAGLDLHAATTAAARATARYLANRDPATIRAMDQTLDLAELDETAWRAARFGPDLGSTAPPETEFSLEVQGDRLAGRSGCNRYMGSWSIENGRLQIGKLASTKVFCDGLMELEGAFLAALEGATSAALEGERLILANEAGQPVIELERVEAPPAP
jgi:heat shock protein HslJ